MTSGSGSATGSAHSTVTGFPHTLTLPLIRRRRACAADLWSSYSRKQKPRFFFLSSGWWYNITSWRPSVGTRQNQLSDPSSFTADNLSQHCSDETPSLCFWNLTCNFAEVFQYTLSCLVLRNWSDKQAIVCDRYAHSQVLARADFVVITLRRKPEGKWLNYVEIVWRHFRTIWNGYPFTYFSWFMIWLFIQHCDMVLTSFTAFWASSLLQYVMKA